ncbi:MAG TPA: hypothetical protein VHJ20_19635 [Polyangia bacterium]|nr:hypothetical protein [Polyangia bacterium]
MTVEKLDVDRYRLTCGMSLDQCLVEGGNKVCPDGGYFVERAVNDANYRGRQDTPEAQRSSIALLRCAPAHGYRDGGKALMQEPAAAPKDAPAPAPRAAACTPGATQTCVGPAACQGGQACLPDGSGFAPCDCGSHPASP